MVYVKDSLDTEQIEDGFSNSKSIKGYRGSYPLPDPEQHETSYNLLTEWDPREKLLQCPLFRKESTSELTAKTKGSDRIFIIKLDLSQSLIVHEGTHNPILTLKVTQRNSGVCLVRQLTNTTNHTISTPERRSILNPNEPWTDLQP